MCMHAFEEELHFLASIIIDVDFAHFQGAFVWSSKALVTEVSYQTVIS